MFFLFLFCSLFENIEAISSIFWLFFLCLVSVFISIAYNLEFYSVRQGYIYFFPPEYLIRSLGY